MDKIKNNNLYIINADRLENNHLVDVSINIISDDNIIKERIGSEKANILLNTWEIKQLKIFSFDDEGNITIIKKKSIEFNSFRMKNSILFLKIWTLFHL